MESHDIVERLLATMLIDVAQAQHQANLYVAGLAKYYANPEENGVTKDLQYFLISSPTIRSFGLNIKFALEELNYYLTNTIQEAVQALVAKIMDGAGPTTGKLPGKETLVRRISVAVKEGIISKLLELKTESTEVATKNLRFLLQDALIRELHAQSGVADAVTQALQLEADSIRRWAEETHKRIQRLQKQPLGEITPVYDFKLLTDAKESVICSITLNIDMNNLQVGFKDLPAKDEITGGNGKLTEYLLI